MREILFRGKRIDNGEWLEGYYGFDDDKPLIAINKANGINGYFVAAETVGQYTGLTANGKKIFEGDIVGTRIWSEWDDTTVWREGVVVFENGGFRIRVDDNINIAICEERYEEPYFKILGNIYDNPELLEDKP